jgi:peptidoglycan/LPS O-acetylase OafA/YrhL
LKEIKEITGMRGIAAQSVIFFHFCAISPVLQNLVISSIGVPLAWNSGVDFFFILSGFLLSIPFMRMEKISLKGYYLKRALRIFPAYYVSFAFIVLFFSNHVTLPQIITSAFYAQNFFKSTFTSINGVYWTLTIEEIFYASLPLFALLFIKRRWIYSLAGCIIVSTVYREVIFSIYAGKLQLLNFYLWQYPSYVEHYAIGATLAALYVGSKFIPRRINSPLLVATIGALIVTEYYLGVNYHSNLYDYPLSNLALAIEFAGLIYFALSLQSGSKLRSLFTNKVASATGKLSYSTYLWHLPVLATLYAFRLSLGLWIISSYLLTMTLAAFTYLLVERPFLRLKDKISISKTPAIGDKKHDVLEDPLFQKPRGGGEEGLKVWRDPFLQAKSFEENPRRYAESSPR